MTNFPNGVSSFGMPVLPQMLQSMKTGRVYWVSNNSTTPRASVKVGQDAAYPARGSFERPFATVDYAIGQCRANAGDIIIVKEGHVEAIAANGTNFNMDVAGVTIVGLGTGADKPEFTYANTASRINVTAADCTLQNVRLTAGVGDVVTAVLHATAAQRTTYRNIEFAQSSTFNFINCYTLGAANISDDCLWEGNYLSTTDAGQLSLCVTAAAHDGLKWINNYVSHAAAQPGLLAAAAVNLTRLYAKGNFVQTAQSDGAVGVLIATSSTASSGCLVDNDMKTADAALNVAIPIASKVYAARNYIAGADEVGTVIAVGTLFDNA